MRYLNFDTSEPADGVTTLEAMASTSAAHHAAALAEVQQVLAWARLHFPHSHAPAGEGMGLGADVDWDHDLQVQVEAGGWHTVSLTLAVSERFICEWQRAQAEFGAC